MTVKSGKDLFLRELTKNDYDRILEIVRACAARSTRKLYHSYKDNNFKHNMNDIFEKDFLSKLHKNFKHFDNMMTKERIIYSEYGERRLFTINHKDFIDKFALKGVDYQVVIT